MQKLPKSASFTVQAVAIRRPSHVLRLCNNIAKHYFARYLLVDANGTKMLFWTVGGAVAWLPYGASELVRIVDTNDFTIIFERKQAYAY